jgi:hypothetical protein
MSTAMSPASPPPIPAIDADWVGLVAKVSASLDAPVELCAPPVPVEYNPPPVTADAIGGENEPPTNPEIVLGWVYGNKVTAPIVALWLAATFASSFITWLLFR